MTTEAIAAQKPSTFTYPPNTKLWLSWGEAVTWIEAVCGPVDLQHLRNIANRKDTFQAGKRANAPFPMLYLVERASFEAWLYGHGRKS